jgi:hypothetical protein
MTERRTQRTSGCAGRDARDVVVSEADVVKVAPASVERQTPFPGRRLRCFPPVPTQTIAPCRRILSAGPSHREGGDRQVRLGAEDWRK